MTGFFGSLQANPMFLAGLSILGDPERNVGRGLSAGFGAANSAADNLRQEAAQKAALARQGAADARAQAQRETWGKLMAQGGMGGDLAPVLAQMDPDKGGPLLIELMQRQKAEQFEREKWDTQRRHMEAQTDALGRRDPTSTDDITEFNFARHNGFQGSFMDFLDKRKALSSGGQPTSDIQNYQYSVGQGFKGSFDEWRKQNRPDGIPNSLQTEAARASQAFDTLGAELDDFERLVAGTVGKQPAMGVDGKPIAGSGVTWWPGAERDQVLQKRRNIQLQLKELYNLGVLNGPDLQLMDTMLFDTSGWDSGIDTSSRVQNSVQNLKNMMKRLKDDKVRTFSSPLKREEPTPEKEIDMGDGFMLRVR